MKNLIIVIMVFSILLLSGCDDNNSDGSENTTPSITSLSPGFYITNLGQFTLTVNGANFNSTSVVVFNEVDITTNYISETQLTAVVPANMIPLKTQETPAKDITVNVEVRNNAPKTETSSSVSFTFRNNFTFSSPSQISNISGNASLPEAAIDSNDRIHLVWYGQSQGSAAVYYSHSQDSAGSFSTPVQLSPDGKYGLEPSIFIGNNNNIYVAFITTTTLFYDVYLTVSTDGGESFSTPKAVHTSVLTPQSPTVVFANNYVHVAWSEASGSNLQILYARSGDGGASFSTPLNISSSPRNCYSPLLLPAYSKMFAIWDERDGAYYNVYYNYGNSYGAGTWSVSSNITWGTPVAQVKSMIFGGDGNLYAIYESNKQGKKDVILRKSADQGGSFGDEIKLSESNIDSYLPNIIMDNFQNLNVVYQEDNDSTTNAYYLRSTDGAQNFTTPVKISNNSSGSAISSMYPRVIADSRGFVYIIYAYDGKLYIVQPSFGS